MNPLLQFAVTGVRESAVRMTNQVIRDHFLAKERHRQWHPSIINRCVIEQIDRQISNGIRHQLLIRIWRPTVDLVFRQFRNAVEDQVRRRK